MEGFMGKSLERILAEAEEAVKLRKAVDELTSDLETETARRERAEKLLAEMTEKLAEAEAKGKLDEFCRVRGIEVKNAVRLIEEALRLADPVPPPPAAAPAAPA